MPAAIGKFLDRGGVIVWGIVPAGFEAFAQEEIPSLIQRLEGVRKILWSKGIDREQLIAPYLDKARQVMKIQAMQQNLEEPSTEPRVQIQIADPEKYNLVLRVPVPARKRARLEQDITRHYLKLLGNSDEGPPVSNT